VAIWTLKKGVHPGSPSLVTFRLDNNSVVDLVVGEAYDLTVGEKNRLASVIELESGGTPSVPPPPGPATNYRVQDLLDVGSFTDGDTLIYDQVQSEWSGLNVGTSVQDLQAVAVRKDRVAINVLDFDGVDRNGEQNSFTPLQAAITSAAGGTLRVPYGSYRSLSPLVLPPSGITMILDDAVLDLSDVGAGSRLLSVAGSLAAPVNLTGAAAAGATSLSVAAGAEAGFAAGDIVKVTSSDVFDPGRTNSTHGELAVLSSTASGILNLRSPLMGAYSTTPQVRKVTTSKLKLRGTGRIVGGGSGSGHYGIEAKFLQGLRVDGVEFRDCEIKALELWDCIDFEIENIDVQGSNDAGTGYGVSFVNACAFGRLRGSHFRDCRHATSTNNSSLNAGGVPRHVTVEGCVSRDSTGAAFDAHAAAEHMTWNDCEVYDSAAQAFNVECNKARVVDCEGYRIASEGIRLLAAAAGATSYLVQRCKIEDAALEGFRMLGLASSGATAPERFDVLDNTFVRCATGGARVDPTAGGFRLVGAKVNRNRAYACNGGGGLAGIYVAVCDASQVCENQAIEQPVTIAGTRLSDFTRGRWAGNITSFAAAATSKAHFGQAVLDSDCSGNIARNANGAGCEGLELDAASANCVILGSGLRGATVPLQLNGVTSHITTTTDASGAYNKVA
jgi:hypothetical protein